MGARTARGEPEAADIAVAAHRPRFPADPLVVARGRCGQRAKRGAEAGREPGRVPGPNASRPALCSCSPAQCPTRPELDEVSKTGELMGD